MNWDKMPLGMIRLDELQNIVQALALTDCDQRTLAIVARATGLGEYFPGNDVPPAQLTVEMVEKTQNKRPKNYPDYDL